MPTSVAALIPAFNCANQLGRLVREVRALVGDVVVVDDGSRDTTVHEARTAGARVVSHAHNRGKASALRTGLALLLGEDWSHVLMLDGDGQHDPADIPALITAASEADFVLGTRLWNPAAIPARRYWTNFVGTRALALMTGYPLEDSQCGYRLVASAVLRRMGLVGRRYAIDTELLVRASKLGASFAHVRVGAVYNGAPSHFRPVADTTRIVLAAVRFKVDTGDLRHDPGPEAWRRRVPSMEVLPPFQTRCRGGQAGPAGGDDGGGPVETRFAARTIAC
jgi:glycosyltransferase involved in cell wall biosynthesis